MAQLQIGSKSLSRVKTLRWLKIRTETQFEILIGKLVYKAYRLQTKTMWNSTMKDSFQQINDYFL